MESSYLPPDESIAPWAACDRAAETPHKSLWGVAGWSSLLHHCLIGGYFPLYFLFKIMRTYRTKKPKRKLTTLDTVPKIIIQGYDWKSSSYPSDSRKKDTCATVARKLLKQLQIATYQVVVVEPCKPKQDPCKYFWDGSRLWSYEHVFHNLSAFPMLKQFIWEGGTKFYFFSKNGFVEIDESANSCSSPGSVSRQ